MPALPFKLNAKRRHRIPKQRHKVMNSAAYGAALRQRGSLTVWFTDEAITAWKAQPRTTRGGQPLSASLTSLRGIAARWYSPLSTLTALTLRAAFRLALCQTEELIGSILHLLGLALAMPDHSTLSRRAETLAVPRPRPCSNGEPLHLLVDSTGLKLCGAGEWLIEKHGTKTCRSWRKLHLGLDADTGRIVAAALTTKEVDGASQVGPLLDTDNGAYDQAGVSAAVAARRPEAAIIVPPRSTAVPNATAETAPTQRDHHLGSIAKHGRAAWQRASGTTKRARAEAGVGRFKQVIGDVRRAWSNQDTVRPTPSRRARDAFRFDGLRSCTDRRRTTEVGVAVHALNRMLDLGRPISVRVA